MCMYTLRDVNVAWYFYVSVSVSVFSPLVRVVVKYAVSRVCYGNGVMPVIYVSLFNTVTFLQTIHLLLRFVLCVELQPRADNFRWLFDGLIRAINENKMWSCSSRHIPASKVMCETIFGLQFNKFKYSTRARTSCRQLNITPTHNSIQRQSFWTIEWHM